jgi:hypothetical protein
MTAYNGLHNKDDMIGLQFNNWTVLEYSHKSERSGNWYYVCQCTCGNKSIVIGTKLRKGGSKQCKKCSGKHNGRKGLYARNENTDLYLIRCGIYVKIGITTNLTERLRTIRSSNPFSLEVEYYGLGKGYLEEYWHNEFKEKHHQGEWYCLSVDDVEKVKLSGACEITF